MKGNEYLKKISKIGLKPLTIIVGPDPFLLDFTVKKVGDVFGISKSVSFADEIKAQDVLKASSSLDLFGSGKTLKVVRHTEVWKSDEFIFLKEHKKVLLNPIVLLYQGKSLPKGVDFVDDDVTDVVVYHEYRADTIARWAKRKMQSMEIKTPIEIEEKILSNLPRRLGEITNELEKLKLLVGEREVREEDLEVLSNPQKFSIFNLIDALAQRDRKKALKIALGLIDEPHVGIMLLSALHKTVLQFLGLKLGNSLTSYYPVPQWKKRKLIETARYATYSELSQQLLNLLEWDIGLKRGYQGPVSNLLISLGLNYPLEW